MKKIKVITIIGTRPEIIRLSRVINELDSNSAIDHVLIHTGQNYDFELNEIFFKDLKLRKPDYFLEAAGKNANETIGKIIIKVDPILDAEKPDALLILGDTNSCLCAIPAKKRKIPIFHMEAGNRCFDQRVPEEINRRIVDHVSDVNLTYSSIAREYLLREGLPPDLIIKTGSPMFEILHNFKTNIISSKVLSDLGLEKQKYFIVSAHREENVGNEAQFTSLIESLNEIAKKYKMPIIVSTHPRTRNMLSKLNLTTNPLIQWMKPLGFFDYNNLQLNSYVALSDSGTISEESAILNFRALNLREAHERPEAMEEGSVMMVGLKSERIIQGIETLKDQELGEKDRNFRLPLDYSNPNVSLKVVRIIISYIDYVNRKVWQKYEL